MYIYSGLLHLASLQIGRNPGAHQKYIVTSQTPGFYAQQNGADQGREGNRLSLVSLRIASWGRLTEKLSSGYLADTGWTPLANKGPHCICWGELSTSWPDGKWKEFLNFFIDLFYKGWKAWDLWVPCDIIIIKQCKLYTWEKDQYNY